MRVRGPSVKATHEKHLHSRKGRWSPEYTVWAGMIRRCENRRDGAFSNYGAKGITVCRRWRHSFLAFLQDMGPRPVGTWIDRIDNALGYGPNNCRWASVKQQQRNRSDNRMIRFRGRTLCLSEWAELKGITLRNLWHRLARGWSVRRALTQPLRSWP